MALAMLSVVWQQLHRVTGSGPIPVWRGLLGIPSLALSGQGLPLLRLEDGAEGT